MTGFRHFIFISFVFSVCQPGAPHLFCLLRFLCLQSVPALTLVFFLFLLCFSFMFCPLLSFLSLYFSFLQIDFFPYYLYARPISSAFHSHPLPSYGFSFCQCPCRTSKIFYLFFFSYSQKFFLIIDRIYPLGYNKPVIYIYPYRYKLGKE